MGVPPMKHGQDARATPVNKEFCKILTDKGKRKKGIRMIRVFGAMMLCAATFASAANLLVNGGFEDELTSAWERRTPDSAARKIWRATGEGRSGAAAVLENVEPVQTRLRQGHDRSIKIKPGSRIELTAWIKSAMNAEGVTSLQIYCMNEKGGIVSQPIAVGPGGTFDWTRFRLRTVVPEGTAYVMAYLQINQGVGKAWFDDVALTVRQPPEPLPPEPTVVLFSDLPDDHATVKNAKILFGAGLVKATGTPTTALANAAGALALYDGALSSEVWPMLKGFTEKGGRVFMDMRCFAAAHGSAAVAVKVGDPAVKNLQAQMQAGLKVVREDDATAGFATGQVIPRMGWTDGKLLVLPQDFSAEGLEVLAEGPSGEPGLVKQTIGKGRITACDLLSLREPFYRNVDAYHAFTPVSGALGNPASFGQYYPKKMPYDGVVAEMRRLAEKYPAISIEDEGEASGGYRLWSLNLGTPGKSFYFLYSSAHGSEWEPGYGLMTFARHIAEGRMRDAVDLSAVRIKIIPLINPSGYDKRQRQNANGVDLNRQGDYRWERYKGRDSNNDGAYGPFDYDWKGAAPFTEPEAVAYKRIISDPTLHCILDFHGNTSVKANKFGILPVTAHPDNEDRALAMQRIANLRLRGRHLLRQNDEKEPSQYLLDFLIPNSGIPGLMNNGAAGRFGFLIEMTCGYGESYGTVLQTDFVCEMCRALFIAYR
jgi:hypothetical protein